MEENKTMTPEEEIKSLQGQCDGLKRYAMELENRLRAIDMTAVQLSWLFRVLEMGEKFRTGFVQECAHQIEKILTPPKEEGKKEA